MTRCSCCFTLDAHSSTVRYSKEPKLVRIPPCYCVPVLKLLFLIKTIEKNNIFFIFISTDQSFYLFQFKSSLSSNHFSQVVHICTMQQSVLVVVTSIKCRTAECDLGQHYAVQTECAALKQTNRSMRWNAIWTTPRVP